MKSSVAIWDHETHFASGTEATAYDIATSVDFFSTKGGQSWAEQYYLL